MAEPQIKIIAVSNIFSKLMHFENAGDVEVGHRHNYDHATLISSGSVRYEVLDGLDGNVVASKDVVAPNFVFVDKDKYHRITALSSNTVCVCIHALRTIQSDLLDPDFLLQPLNGGSGLLRTLVNNQTGEDFQLPAKF
jgi:hypothetical protein